MHQMLSILKSCFDINYYEPHSHYMELWVIFHIKKSHVRDTKQRFKPKLSLLNILCVIISNQLQIITLKIHCFLQNNWLQWKIEWTGPFKRHLSYCLTSHIQTLSCLWPKNQNNPELCAKDLKSNLHVCSPFY